MIKEIDVVSYINEKIEKCIIDNKLIQDKDKIVVAVSGGPDSMCLLSVLYELQSVFKIKYNIDYTLVVAHVNHMIREESEQEKVYVEEFCNKLNIPFFYLKENIPILAKKLKLSEETCGRKVRYEFFESVLKKVSATKIATAHNLNDDCETILLNLIRGTGLNGLTGMKYMFKNIIRPLLDVKKADIMLYNNEKNINPCIDKTNFECVYIRNKVRNILIPSLEKEYNSNFVNNIIRMKHLISKDEIFLDEYTENIVKKAVFDNNINSIKFNFSCFLNECDAIKSRFVRKIIELKLNDLDGITNIHVNDIINLLEKNIKGKKYIIGNKFIIEILSKNVAVIY